MEEKIKCPFCGSESFARILYGMPVFSEELEKEIEEGRTAIGGCCIFPDSPEYQCNSCNKEWGTHMNSAGEPEE